MDQEFIFLDYASATPISDRVLRAMEPYFQDEFYNPSAIYAPAIKVKQDYVRAKDSLARSLGVKSGEITITAGATESINLAFFNFARDGHVVTTAIEHPAVLQSAELYQHSIVSVGSSGVVSVDDIKNAITEQTTLISIAIANNELGTLQPLKKITQLIGEVRKERLDSGNDRPIFLHTDASQGASLLDISVSRLGIDMMTLNAGKIYGPKQVGLLWVRSGILTQPQIVGGGQEKGLRSGTENMAGVVGFAKALEVAQEKRKSENLKLGKLRDSMEKKIKEEIPQAIFSGDHKRRLANFLHVSFPGLDGERLVYRLENVGVLVATGSACSANHHTGSHVLKSIGLNQSEQTGSIRITLGSSSNNDNIKKATQLICEQVKSEYDRISK